MGETPNSKHINNLLGLLLGLLEISPVERGVVTLFGVRSGLFLAMNGKGKLYGSVSMLDGSECCPVFLDR